MSLTVVLSTCPPEQAEALAAALLERRLAACINILPQLTSHYRWQQELCREVESLLIIKTTCAAELFPALKDLHPYEVPEIVSLDAADVLPAYLQWATEQCLT